MTSILLPSAVQTGGLPPPARGAVLSPPTPPPISKSKFVGRLRGFAFGVTSLTQRSGCAEDRTGWLEAAMNASCLPAGLKEKPPAAISNDANFTGSPPLTETENRSVR